MTDPRYKKLATLLARYSTELKKGDRVLLDMIDDPALILRDLLEIGHDAARAQALGDGARIIGGADWVGRIRTLAVQLSPAQLSRLWQMLLKALEETGKAPDPIAAVEMAIVRLCAAQSLPPPEEAARLLRDGGSWTAEIGRAHV